MPPARAPARRDGPADRVRRRIRRLVGAPVAAQLPAGYQRLGRVLLLRLPERLRPHFSPIGAAWQAELGVVTVLARVGPVSGELRKPSVERIAGTETETEVVEHGVRWRFDAAHLLFAAGNRSERARARELVRPGERVVDLFAGIGYFAIPAARSGPATRVLAVEKNPVAYRYLLANIRANGVEDRVTALLGDNRTVPLPLRAADRVFLGYLPDAVPWLARAIPLLHPEGGWVHVHTLVDARDGTAAAIGAVRAATAALGATVLEPLGSREVKPYGPGRTHVVVDARIVAGR
jgi:tRNA wybutosine-synthesizing protein 2